MLGLRYEQRQRSKEMLWRAISGYLELALILGLFMWGVGMIFYAVVGTTVGIVRSIPLHILVLFVLVCIFLSLAG